MYTNWICKRLSYALSVWAGCFSMIIGAITGKTSSVIFMRSAIAFLLFGILGYIAGRVLHWVMQPKLAFINEKEEEEEEEDNNDGESVESL